MAGRGKPELKWGEAVGQERAFDAGLLIWILCLGTGVNSAFFVQVDYCRISGEVHDEAEAKHARIRILEIASGKHWVRPAGSEKKNG